MSSLTFGSFFIRSLDSLSVDELFAFLFVFFFFFCTLGSSITYCSSSDEESGTDESDSSACSGNSTFFATRLGFFQSAFLSYITEKFFFIIFCYFHFFRTASGSMPFHLTNCAVHRLPHVVYQKGFPFRDYFGGDFSVDFHLFYQCFLVSSLVFR